MILIIDYGMGNLRNVMKAFNLVGYEDVVISNNVEDVQKADAFVIAGVGAFGDAMDNLENLGLIKPLTKAVIEEHKPIIGICLGVQLLAKEGYENGKNKGLGFLPMVVRKLDPKDKTLRIPHIGWNNTHIVKKNSLLFKNVPNNIDFYYVHSFYTICEKKKIVAATSDYGGEFVSSVEYKNIFGTQFHPEKSHKYGLQILSNFVNHVKLLEKK